MKLVQKLLSHGLLIGFFVASFFTYMYRAELFPQWFGDTTRTAALPVESQSVRANAPAGQPAGKVDSGANTGSPLPAKTAGETASLAQVTADLPPLMVPGGEAPTPDSRGMQGNTSDLPPLASASDVDQASPQPPAAAPGAAPSAPEPAAAVGFSADRAFDNAAPPPARYRPLDAQQLDTAPPLPDEATVQDAAVAPLAVPENISPPQDTASDVDQVPPQPLAAAPDAAPSAPEPAAAVGFSADRALDNATPPPARYRPLDAQQLDTAPPQDTAPFYSAPVAAEQPQSEPVTSVTVENAAAQVKPQPPTEPAATVRPDTIPVQAEAPDAAPASGVQEFQQQLAVARTYFWRRDVRGALQAYQNLARVWPAQADAWGELGNLYLRIGNRSAAAEAYYRTMSILLDQGETERAHDLLEVLYGLDAARASEMEKRFIQVSS